MESLVTVVSSIVLIVGPFAALALAAGRYGTDSRPSIDDRDQRPWLVSASRG